MDNQGVGFRETTKNSGPLEKICQSEHEVRAKIGISPSITAQNVVRTYVNSSYDTSLAQTDEIVRPNPRIVVVKELVVVEKIRYRICQSIGIYILVK